MLSLGGYSSCPPPFKSNPVKALPTFYQEECTIKQFLIYIKSLPLFSFVAVIILGAAISAFSQETTGSIEGTIKDPQGNLVAGVPVTVTGVTLGFTRVPLRRMTVGL